MSDSVKRMGRRNFLAQVTLGTAATPSLWQARRPRPGLRGSPALAKQPLTQADFEYAGVLRVPQDVSGFSVGAMTARKDGASIRFYMTGHRYGDAVFEFNGLPPAPNVESASRPSVLTAWGTQVYGDKRTSWQNNGVVRTPSAWWTGGLCWYNGQLFWTYYDGYNVSGWDDFVLGMTRFGVSGSATAYGPWRTQASSHKASGWVIEIPADFGDEFCAGARLGVGAGLTSGNVSSSWGPILHAMVPPLATTPAGYGSAVLPTTPLVGHSMDHRQVRDSNYIFHWQPEIPPSAGVGYWTSVDFLTGACWIDLPDKHGLLFAGSLGAGDVWYGGYTLPNGVADACGMQTTGPHAASYETRWWICDPADLARVATGEVAQWDIQPSTIFDPRSIKSDLALGCPPAMAGMWFDPLTRLLYVAAPGADPQPYVQTPLIHVWHIK